MLLTRCFKSALLLLCMFGVTSCGFSPMHLQTSDDNQSVAQIIGNTDIDIIADREGQMLRNRLIDRMWLKGAPQNPEQTIAITLNISTTDLGIRKDATTSRQRMTIKADYLLRRQDGSVRAKGSVTSTVNTNKTDEQYGAVASIANAKERALRELADQIVNIISLEARK